MRIVRHDRACEVDEENGQYFCGCADRMDDAYDQEMDARVDRERDRWVDDYGGK